MTVANNPSRDQYTATSGQTVFPYTFEIFDKDDVVVLKNGATLAEGTNYTVSGVGNDNGGNITLTTGASTGEIITIYRDMPLERTTDYQTSGDFLAAEVNNDFDRLWLASQQLDNNASRAVRKPESDLESLNMELPPAATRANTYFSFGGSGEISLKAISDPSISAGINIYVDDYGAVGDGVTDDTAAIKSAIAAAFATASNYDKYTFGDDTFRKTGTFNIVFGNRKAYKITETLDLQGAQGIDNIDGVGNYYGCNITVDFGGSTIMPAPKAGTIPNPALIMWGQSSEFKRLRLDFTQYNTQQEVYDQQVVGVAITPTLATEISTGGAEAYNCVYEQIEIFGTWRGFELKQNLAFSYRNRWVQCQVRGCSDYGWYMKGDPLVGDNTTNVLSQCHVNASVNNVGRSNGGVNYLCIKAHDPALVDAEPGVGADWLDYWADNSQNAPYPATIYPAWSGSEDFYLSSGGGYYFDACGGISFDATASMDSVITNPDKPGIYFKSRFLSITGGLHLERNRVLADNSPLIAIGGGTAGRGGDVFIDAIYAPNPYYDAPNTALLIGGISADPARSLFLNSYVELVADGTTTNRKTCDVTYIDNAQFGAGISPSLIIGENNGYVFLPQSITAIRQFKEQSSPTANYTFTPTSKESGTHYRYNTSAAFYQEMDVSGTASADIVDGAYFEMCTINSTSGYTATAGQSRITGTGSNVHGPTVAKNGQTLCIQKQDNVFLTWIKPTAGYASSVKSVYTQALDEYTVAGGLPAPSVWQNNMIIVSDAPNGYTPAFCDGTDWLNLIHADASGNVGIGTTSPAASLHMKSSGDTQLWLDSSATSVSNRIASLGQNGGAYKDLRYDAGQHLFRIGTTERARIDASGNLLVGTTGTSFPSLDAKLVSLTSANKPAIFANVNVASSTATSGIAVRKYDNNNTTSQTYVAFQYNQGSNGAGGIQGNGANGVQFFSSSDARLKENITGLDPQLANIIALKPSKFDFIDGPKNCTGFIAQEVEEIYPDLVSETHDGYKTLGGLSVMEARLVKAIQEQQEQINELKAEVAKLKGAN